MHRIAKFAKAHGSTTRRVVERLLMASERDNPNGGGAEERRSIAAPIYIGAPSGTGKTTMLNRLRVQGVYDVDDSDYERLLVVYDRDQERVREHLLTKRTERRVYEHTPECAILYPIVHKYVRYALEHEIALDKHMLGRLRQEVMNSLYNLQERDGRRVVVIIDLTKAYRDRYFERLRKRNNGIDYDTVDYLYAQVAAFMAFFGLTLPPPPPCGCGYRGCDNTHPHKTGGETCFQDLGSSWVRIVIVADKEQHSYLLGAGHNRATHDYKVFGESDRHGIINSLRNSIVENRLMGIPASSDTHRRASGRPLEIQQREILLMDSCDLDVIAEYVLREPSAPQRLLVLKEVPRPQINFRTYTPEELERAMDEHEAKQRYEAMEKFCRDMNMQDVMDSNEQVRRKNKEYCEFFLRALEEMKRRRATTEGRRAVEQAERECEAQQAREDEEEEAIEAAARQQTEELARMADWSPQKYEMDEEERQELLRQAKETQLPGGQEREPWPQRSDAEEEEHRAYWDKKLQEEVKHKAAADKEVQLLRRRKSQLQRETALELDEYEQQAERPRPRCSVNIEAHDRELREKIRREKLLVARDQEEKKDGGDIINTVITAASLVSIDESSSKSEEEAKKY